MSLLRNLLPMADHVRGKRSPVTCALKCGNACLGEVCNTSQNAYFRDIASAALSRRSILGGAAAGALAIAVTTAPSSPLAGAAHAAGNTKSKSKLVFDAIDPVNHEVDGFHVPEGFTWKPIARWGDALFPDSPEFDPEDQSEEAQKRQFGYNCDFLSIQLDPAHKNGKRAVMFTNHEYVNEGIMYPDALPAAERRAISRAAKGLSVVELQRQNKNSEWTVDVSGPRNRRFVMETEYTFTGPAAGSELLRTADYPAGDKVQGTVGNCAGGLTPWGTLLSGEENFNGYFAAAGTSAEDKRYGLGGEGNGWAEDDPRWDTRNAGYENEANRFGYIVEVDPWDPTSTPLKHTSLGRFKHEGANVTISASGHAVAYSGDDERFDYLYKFVSNDTYREGDRAHNMTLLSEGNLYVAKFDGNSAAEIDGSGALPADGAFDGTGEWLPLVENGESKVPGMSVAEVLVYTRLAADLVGPTKMDRCEDVEPSPTSGRIYVACTNNTNRGTGTNAPADEVNPRTRNRDGHVVEIAERDGDHTSTVFDWNLLLVCGDPAQGTQTYFGGFPEDRVSPISCPDNLAFDSQGDLWISTDGQPGTIGYNDGLFRVRLEGEVRGQVEQFLSVPREAETCGPVIHDEERTVFVAVQHPGEDGAYTDQHSAFPDYVTEAAGGRAPMPRPTVVQVLRGRPAEGSEDWRQRRLIGDLDKGQSLREGLATA